LELGSPDAPGLRHPRPRLCLATIDDPAVIRDFLVKQVVALETRALAEGSTRGLARAESNHWLRYVQFPRSVPPTRWSPG